MATNITKQWYPFARFKWKCRIPPMEYSCQKKKKINLNQIKHNSQALVSSLFIYHICTGTKDTEVNKIDLMFPKELLSLLPWWLRNMSVMQETWVQSLGQEDPLEEEMATHSSILAWKIPRMEDPGGLQSMGLQRAGHDWATNTFTFKELLL